MQDLVGQCFSLADGQYRIVDVRFVGRDSMVYAEKAGQAPASALPTAPKRPQRAAFHYDDIAPYLSA
jgi:hypothetical protein